MMFRSVMQTYHCLCDRFRRADNHIILLHFLQQLHQHNQPATELMMASSPSLILWEDTAIMNTAWMQAHGGHQAASQGLLPATYDVRIRDAAFIACVIDLGNQVIHYPVTLSATVTPTQPTCNGTDDGTITITDPLGGYGNMNTNGCGRMASCRPTYTGLAPATYDVRIRDAAPYACVIDLGNQVIHYPVILSATVNQHNRPVTEPMMAQLPSAIPWADTEI